jgi:SAM domain (Sterile alpha motif)
MQPIAEWLANIGVERYAPAFAGNDIDVSVLPHVTDADLEKIGVSLGHRRKILAAVADTITEPKRRQTAERLQLTDMFAGHRPLKIAFEIPPSRLWILSFAVHDVPADRCPVPTAYARPSAAPKRDPHASRRSGDIHSQPTRRTRARRAVPVNRCN